MLTVNSSAQGSEAPDTELSAHMQQCCEVLDAAQHRRGVVSLISAQANTRLERRHGRDPAGRRNSLRSRHCGQWRRVKGNAEACGRAAWHVNLQSNQHNRASCTTPGVRVPDARGQHAPGKFGTRLRTAHASTSTFRKTKLVYLFESSSKKGAIILHGPHHEAVKSITT